MATGAGIVFVLIVAGVIIFDVVLLGRRFDRRMEAMESDQEGYKE